MGALQGTLDTFLLGEVGLGVPVVGLLTMNYLVGGTVWRLHEREVAEEGRCNLHSSWVLSKGHTWREVDESGELGD